jgi:hypothetical protein
VEDLGSGEHVRGEYRCVSRYGSGLVMSSLLNERMK